MKRAIVVTEVALAVTLLTGAGLLIRSFDRLLAVDPGFQPESVLTFRALLPDRAYSSDTAIRNFARAIDERLGALPGVRDVAISNGLPLDGSDMTITFGIHGHAPVPENQRPASQIIVATPGFFSTLGIQLTRGRAFTEEDRAGAPQVAVVNEEFVRRFMKGEDPVGQSVDLDWSSDGVRRGGTIVGIAHDVKQRGLDQQLPPIVYLPLEQAPLPDFSVAVRTSTPPGAVTRAVRAEVRQLDPNLPLYSVRTLEELVSSSISSQRFYTLLLGIFASVALTLAAIGLYGVIAYAVGQRTHEMGVRVALGATGERIARMVVAEGFVLVVAGLALGLVAAAGLSRLLQSLLFGVGTSDPVTFAAVAVVLLLVAAVASYLPARRAGRVDPLIAMRGD